MSNPFVPTSVSSYNANPPADDGSQVASNLVAWATIKSKLPDPIKAAFDTSETATNNAFAKIVGGGGFTSTAVDYTVLAADQGKFVKCTVSGKVITTPDATIVGSPFVFLVVNESTGDITFKGNNPGVQQNIDGVTSVTIPSGAGVIANTDGTNWFTGGQNFTKTQIVPQGRLTLVSGSAVITSDQTAKTAVFYTPYQGDQIPIPNGSIYSVKTFTELTLTLNGTNYTTPNLYDVFVFLDPADGSTIKIGTGPSWGTATAGSGARGTGAGTTELVLLKGLWTNNNAITLRNNATTYSVSLKCATYVGTIIIDAVNGQVNCHVGIGQSRKWDVWNAFNRKPIALRVQDSTSSWTYNGSGTYQQSNAAAGNTAAMLIGLAEEEAEIDFSQMSTQPASGTSKIGIGVNSTTSPSGKIGQVGNTTSTQFTVESQARYSFYPAIGVHNINSIETSSGGSATLFGSSNMLMTSRYYA